MALMKKGTNPLEVVTKVVKEAGLLEEVEPDEVLAIANDFGEKSYKKIAKTVAYVRKRFVENVSRREAFKLCFPERCFVTQQVTGNQFGAEHKKIGDPLDNTSIDIKAKRLENSRLYKHIVTMLNTSLYTAYALERMKVLDFTLTKVFDENTKERDRVEYIKTFLQETRKPEKMVDMELNVNVTNNEINVMQIEDKLSEFANKLASADAGSIIEAIQGEKK